MHVQKIRGDSLGGFFRRQQQHPSAEGEKQQYNGVVSNSCSSHSEQGHDNKCLLANHRFGARYIVSSNVPHDNRRHVINHNREQNEGFGNDQMGDCGLYRPAVRAGHYENIARRRNSNADRAFLRIIPDCRLSNDYVEDLLRAICGMYQPPLARWNGRGFDQQETLSWEIILRQRQANFYASIPREWRMTLEKQLAVVWPRATMQQETPDPLAGISPTVVAKLELKNHYMFALRADRRTLGILPSLLECIKLLEPGELMAVQVLLEPAPPDWWQGAASAYEAFRAGKMPGRVKLDAKTVGNAVLRAATWLTLEAINVVNEILTGQPQEPVALDSTDRAVALRERPLGYTVAEKLKGDALDATIRVAAVAPDKIRAQNLLRAVWHAFRSLDGDNSFVMVPGNDRTWQLMLSRQSGFKLNHDYLSPKEASMLVLLPTGPLQQEYKLTAVEYREVELPKVVTSGGLYLGEATFHGQAVPVYLPVKDYDELCLPHVVIGGMGTGKTKGFGANLAVEAVRNGFEAVIIDPAKGEIGDEVEAVLPAEKIIRVRFGQEPVALDWREALHSVRARNRLANELVTFFEAASDEAGAQTVRYLRAAAKAVPGGRLSEVIALLTNAKYRAKLMPAMRPQERTTWEDFGKLSEARQMQIAMPVLNRLDVIMGDDYLAECMDAQAGLDLVQLLEEPRAVVLDVPKAELGTEVVDILVSLIATKLDLAMVLRRSKHPVFIIQDEPHQYLRSARTWKAAAVESRKWRFSYVWMFHAWEQLPRDVAAIIRAAGPHYHIYTSSKATYQALAEEIKPFEVEEAMRTPRHWAINVIRAGGITVTPFLARMAPPPSKRKTPVS